MYCEIVLKYGLSLKECEILSFEFPNSEDSHGCHFKLMAEHIDYLFYDFTDKRTNIALRKTDKEAIEQVKRIAEEYDGILKIYENYE